MNHRKNQKNLTDYLDLIERLKEKLGTKRRVYEALCKVSGISPGTLASHIALASISKKRTAYLLSLEDKAIEEGLKDKENKTLRKQEACLAVKQMLDRIALKTGSIYDACKIISTIGGWKFATIRSWYYLGLSPEKAEKVLKLEPLVTDEINRRKNTTND